MIISSDTLPLVLQEAVKELQRRDEHPFNQYVPTDFPEHNQLNFHKSNHRYRLLFGGNQSGKSLANAHEIAWWLTGKHPYRKVPKPPIYIWNISTEYITILDGVYRHLKRIIPDWEIKKQGPNVVGHPLPSYIEFKNGSIITFKSAKGESREKFQAAGVNLISIDEEISADIFDELEARTLATGGEFIISATLVESYDWILDLEQRGLNNDPDVFISRLDTRRNPYINQKVLGILLKKWSSDTQQYRIEGKSRRSHGLVYNTWENEKHRIARFPIPLEWKRLRAIDPGIRTCAVLWIAIAPDDHAYAYRELYAHNEPLHQIAIAIKSCEGYSLNKELSHKFEHFVWEKTEDRESETIDVSLIDPKAKARFESGAVGILEQLHTRYALSSIPADNELRAGLEDVRQWLDPQADGLPGFRCFEHLDNFLSEVRGYRLSMRKPTKYQGEPLDKPIRKDNHLMDCWRYIARERPKFKKYPRTEEYDDYKRPFNPAEALRKIRERGTVHEYLGSCW